MRELVRMSRMRFVQLLAFSFSFLLFSLELMVGKTLLPFFGGTAGVWSALLLFFISMIPIGYWYAGWVYEKHSALFIHGVVMACGGFIVLINILSQHSVLALDIALGPLQSSVSVHIFILLLASLGIVTIVLSSGTVLLQRYTKEEPYSLFSFSNGGSICALILYPFVIEPLTHTSHQYIAWGIAYAVMCVGMYMYMSSSIEARIKHARYAIPFKTTFLWIAVSAIPTALLIATTEKITQTIAPIPFLWSLPLLCYLLSFITSWNDRSIPRSLLIFTVCISELALLYRFMSSAALSIGFLIIFLYLVCFVFHKKLYSLKPDENGAAHFYSAMGIGGAVGSVFVTFIAPQVFVVPIEYVYITIIASVAILYVLHQSTSTLLGKIACYVFGFVFIAMQCFFAVAQTHVANTVYSARNFYGSARVEHSQIDGRDVTSLVNGNIQHGFSVTERGGGFPTAYFATSTGIGQLLTQSMNEREKLNVGIIGLGAGTLAAYCRNADVYTFVEIDPKIIDIAKRYFPFLAHCPQAEIIEEDGRKFIEHTKEIYDVLVIDAFTDDAIPVHLLTEEAFGAYIQKLKDGGVIAVHISNRYLDLAPVVLASGEAVGVIGKVITNEPSTYAAPSTWILLSDDNDLLPDVNGQAITKRVEWTDDFSNLFSILNIKVRSDDH